MGVCVLLSAMHLEDHSLLEELNIKSDAVVINQCDKDEVRDIKEGGRRILFLSVKDRGLSKSRNEAIRQSDAGGFGDVCIFCDNDCVYEEGAASQIETAFDRNPQADIIVFFIKRPEKSEPVLKKEGPLSYIGAIKIFSPEIAFRRSSLMDRGLFMDEDFGAGARYMMGEENIFLFKAKQMGLKVVYVPLQIAYLKENESTWFKGYTDDYFKSRGAGYRAMAGRLSFLLIWQFAIRKYSLYKADNGFWRALRMMNAGVREYEDICSRRS